MRVDTRFLISKQLTATQYTDVDCNRNLNLWYKRVQLWIIKEEDTWQVGGDELKMDLKKDVILYQAPTAYKLLRVNRAEAKLSTKGEYQYCRINDSQYNDGWNEGNTTRPVDDASSPSVDFFGNYLKLRPAPTEDVINGFKIWAQLCFFDLQDIVNNIPSIAEPVHRAITVGAALDFATSLNYSRKITQFNNMLYGNPSLRGDRGLKGDIEDLYGNHAAAFRPRFTIRRNSYS